MKITVRVEPVEARSHWIALGQVQGKRRLSVKQLRQTRSAASHKAICPGPTMLVVVDIPVFKNQLAPLALATLKSMTT